MKEFPDEVVDSERDDDGLRPERSCEAAPRRSGSHTETTITCGGGKHYFDLVVDLSVTRPESSSAYSPQLSVPLQQRRAGLLRAMSAIRETQTGIVSFIVGEQ